MRVRARVRVTVRVRVRGKGRGAGEGGGAGALERDGVRDLLEGGEVARLAWDGVKVRAIGLGLGL